MITFSLSKKASLFLLFVLFFICLSYVLISGIEKAVDPVSLLPQNTAFLIDVKNPAVAVNRVSNSKLGVQISSIDWQDVLPDIGIPEEDVQEILTMAGELDAIARSPFFNEMFGRRVILGLMPADSIALEPSPERVSIEQMMVLIARPRHRASLVNFFSGFVLNEIDYTAEPYKGREIKTFVNDSNVTFSSTITDGLVIVSFSPERVKQCIDNSISNMTSGRSGLLENANYRQLKLRAMDHDDQFVYIDIPNLQVMIENNLHTAGYPPHSGYHYGSIYGEEPTLQRIAFFSQSENQILKYSSIIQLNPDDAQFRHTVLDQNRPVQDTLLEMLPDDHVLHLWMNIFVPKKLWDFFRSEQNINIQALVKNVEEWILEKTEYSAGELLSFFGNQISLNVAEMKSSGIFPMPRISLYIEIHDKEKVQHILRSLLSGVPVRQSTVSGKEVFSVILAGGLMQPSYTFDDNFLVVTDTREQLESMFSIQKRPLLKNSFFKKVDVGLTEGNNFVLYYRNAELIDGLKELVLWYGSLLQLFDSESEAKNKIILEKIVLPVLDGMKMYKVKTVRAYTSETEIIMKSSQLLENE